MVLGESNVVDKSLFSVYPVDLTALTYFDMTYEPTIGLPGPSTSEIDAACSGDEECVFDALVTSVDVASEAGAARATFEELKLDLSKFFNLDWNNIV